MLYIDKIITFQGSREEPVKLAVVEETIKHLAQRFNVRKIRIESWQGMAAVQNLKALDLPVELFTPTAKAHAEEWPVLAQHLATQTLVLPPHARLREELLNLVYEVGPQGVRVIDKGSVHQDHAVAVRGVVASLSQPERVPYRFLTGNTEPDVRGVEAVQKEADEAVADRKADSAVEIAEAIQGQGFWFPGD